MKRGRKYLPYLLVYINYPTNPIWSAECRPHSSCVAGKKRRFRHPFEPKRHLLRPVCVIAFPFRLFSLFYISSLFLRVWHAFWSVWGHDRYGNVFGVLSKEVCLRHTRIASRFHDANTLNKHKCHIEPKQIQSRFSTIFLPTPLFFDSFVTRYQSFFPFRSFLLFLGPARDHYVFLSSWYLAFHRCNEIKRNKKLFKVGFFFLRLCLGDVAS